METKQNPFSLYDFLGYFTPGAIFIYGCLAVYGHVTEPSSSLSDFIATRLSFEKSEIYIPFILLAYATGHIISFLSSVMIERYSIWSIGYPSRYLLVGSSKVKYLNVGEKHKNLRIFNRIALAIILLPISFLDIVLGKWLGYRDLYAKKLDNLLIALIKAKLLRFLVSYGDLDKAPSDIKDADYFRFVYHWTVEHAPSHLPKMQNYVALYGFLRTLTLLCVLLFWVITWHVIDLGAGFLIISGAILATSSLTFILYMAFVKFYRRFSLESLMALCAVLEKDTD